MNQHADPTSILLMALSAYMVGSYATRRLAGPGSVRGRFIAAMGTAAGMYAVFVAVTFTGATLIQWRWPSVSVRWVSTRTGDTHLCPLPASVPIMSRDNGGGR